MIDDMLEFLFFMAIVATGIVALIFPPITAIQWYQCNKYEEMTGENTEYVVMSGCYIEGELYEVYKMRSATNDGE